MLIENCYSCNLWFTKRYKYEPCSYSLGKTYKVQFLFQLHYPCCHYNTCGLYCTWVMLNELLPKCARLGVNSTFISVFQAVLRHYQPPICHKCTYYLEFQWMTNHGSLPLVICPPSLPNKSVTHSLLWSVSQNHYHRQGLSFIPLHCKYLNLPAAEEDERHIMFYHKAALEQLLSFGELSCAILPCGLAWLHYRTNLCLFCGRGRKSEEHD